VHGLCNQQPVEWVAQRTGQRAGQLAVDERNWQWDEALCAEYGPKIRGDRSYAGQLANADFRCDLPGGRGAGEYCVALVGNGRVCSRR
jgi:hypothetical protein